MAAPDEGAAEGDRNQRLSIVISTVADGPQEIELATRPMRPDEHQHVRRAWWRLSTEGQRLPAERGLIVIDGGRA